MKLRAQRDRDGLWIAVPVIGPAPVIGPCHLLDTLVEHIARRYAKFTLEISYP